MADEASPDHIKGGLVSGTDERSGVMEEGREVGSRCRVRTDVASERAMAK